MSLVVFTDRNMGKRLPAELRKAGILVETHDDHFDETTSDELWLGEVGRRGWLAFTRDRRIRYRANERDAVMGAGVRLMILIGKATTERLAANVVNSFALIEAFVARHQAPFIAKLYLPPAAVLEGNPKAPGRIDLWYS